MFLRRVFPVFCLILASCGTTETFDYDNKNVTAGLTVEPASLEFTAADETKFVSIRFSENDLFLRDIDYAGLGADFKADVPLYPNDCRGNISLSEQGCRIYVRYAAAAPGTYTGKIVLYFSYVKDMGSGKIKEHDINVTGNN